MGEGPLLGLEGVGVAEVEAAEDGAGLADERREDLPDDVADGEEDGGGEVGGGVEEGSGGFLELGGGVLELQEWFQVGGEEDFG